MSIFNHRFFGKLIRWLLILLVISSVPGFASIFAYASMNQGVNVLQEDATVYMPLIASRGGSSGIRTVNATYFPTTPVLTRVMGIFWFGKISPTDNYADVRVGYDDSELVIDVQIIDKYLWYDLDPSVSDLLEWDAVSLFLSMEAEPGSAPGVESYQFIGQLNHWEPREDYQTAYRGNGTGWENSGIVFYTEKGWRGEGFNDNTKNVSGWSMTFSIPFESLGLSAPPHDDIWRLGVSIHDRDDQDNTPISDQIWPEAFRSSDPRTWGNLHFGFSTYSPPSNDYDAYTIVENGVDGAIVRDAHVGGAFLCGAGMERWTQWGNMNYESVDPTQINIQNQRDVADWTCFSKYFTTFPLDAVPEGSTIVSATLTMYHFGNSGIGLEPPPMRSWIQVFTIKDDWTDTSITWNNAPLAFENISMTRVEPIVDYTAWPGIPIEWNVSQAVDAAYQLGAPLRLALYSADSAQNSGKYFYSSDGSARPFLTIYWKNP
jgi:hypothetical protein